MIPQQIDDTSRIVRPRVPALAVTVHRYMIEGPGAITNAIDLMVLVHLLFGVRDDVELTVAGLLERLRAAGVTSPSNVAKPIGRDAVYAAISRLTAAKFVRKTRERQADGTWAPWSYEVYEQPLYNPDVSEVPDFVPLPGQPEVDDKTPGGTTSGSPGYGSPTSGSPGSGQNGHSAGGTTSGSPGSWNPLSPTPPGGGKTPQTPRPSATLLADRPEADTGGGQRSARKTNPRPADDLDPAAVADAENFLRNLPAPWGAGAQTRRKLAPVLVRQCAAEGWTLGPALAAKLTEDRGKVTTPAGALAHRIKDLPPCPLDSRTPVTAAGTPPHVTDPCPTHPFREAAQCLPCRSGSAPEPVQPADTEAPLSEEQQAARAAIRAFIGQGKQERQRTVNAAAGRSRGLAKLRAQQEHQAAEEFAANKAQQLAALERLMAETPQETSG